MTGEESKAAKKGMGCLPKLIILILIILIGGFIAVKLLFPAEKIRAEIVKRASAALQRDVELDDVSLSLFPSLSLDLKGLRIYNPPGFTGHEFIYVEQLSAGLKIWPLFSGEYQFDRIEVMHPVIHLYKLSDGRVNYSFEIDAGEEGVQTPLGEKKEITSKEAAFSAFAFDWAEIKNGDLIYRDDSSDIDLSLLNFSLQTKLELQADGRHGKSIGTIKIPQINTNLLPENLPLDIELAYNADIDFQYADLQLDNSSLQINGIPFQLNATVRNLKDPQSVFAQIKADNVEIEPLLKYLPSSEAIDIEKLRLTGRIGGTAETRIEIAADREPYYAGQFVFRDLTLGYANTSNRFHFDSVTVVAAADSIFYETYNGDLSGQPFRSDGYLKNFDDPIYNFRTAGSYALVGVTPFLDATANPKISGQMRFNITALGQKSVWPETAFKGTVNIDSLYYFDDSLTAALERLDLAVKMGGKKVTVEKLHVEYPGVRADLTGTLKNGFAHLLNPDGNYPKPYLDFNLHAPLVNYDILLPEDTVVTAGAGTPAVTGGGTEGEIVRTPIFLPDIDAGGKVVIDTFVFSEVKITGITGNAKYHDGLIDYSDLKGSIYSGSIQSNGAVDITDMFNPKVTAEFTATDIQANDFMEQFTKAAGHLYGKMDLNGKMTGQGSEIEDFVKSLNAAGKLSMDEGKLVNFDLIKKAANQFKFKTFEEEAINNLVTDVVIRDGNLILDGTKIKTGLGDWDLSGRVDFLNKDLDLGVSLYLAAKHSKDIDLLGGLLQDKDGRVRVNFKMTGPYNSPAISNISTDNEVIKNKIEDKLKDEAKNLINNLFKKK